MDRGKVWFVGIRIVDRTPAKEIGQRVSDILNDNDITHIISKNLVRTSRVMVNIISSNTSFDVIKHKELDKLFDSNHFDEAMNYILEKENNKQIKSINGPYVQMIDSLLRILMKP